MVSKRGTADCPRQAHWTRDLRNRTPKESMFRQSWNMKKMIFPAAATRRVQRDSRTPYATGPWSTQKSKKMYQICINIRNCHQTDFYIDDVCYNASIHAYNSRQENQPFVFWKNQLPKNSRGCLVVYCMSPTPIMCMNKKFTHVRKWKDRIHQI